MKADQTSGSSMVAKGDKYTVCAAGATTNVKGAPGRIVRIVPISGTGTVTVYDNAAGAASGPVLWGPTAQVVGASGVIELDEPALAGIVVVTGAATVCNVVYS